MLAARLISACWIIFVLYWAAGFRSVKAPAERQSRASRLAHRLPVWIGFLLLFAGRRLRLGMVVIPHGIAAGWLGVAVTALGLATAIWARKTLAGNWSANVEFKQDHKLVQHGPYRFVRHPIYTGILLMCLGTAIDIGSLAALLSFPFFFAGFWIKLRMEERLMLHHFPDEYPAYKARVKALIPFVL